MTTGSATLAGTDITSMIELGTVLSEQANHLNGIADILLRDEAGTLVIREMDEFLASADATPVYGGRLRIVHRDQDGAAVLYRCRATTFECLLDLRVIESGNRTGSRTDADDVAFLLAYCADLGVTDMTYVLTLKPTGLEDIDYTGLSVRQAMDRLAVIVGATYWLDSAKKPHWTDPRSTQIVVNGTFDTSAASWTLDGSAAWTASSGPAGTGDGALVTTGNGSGMHESTETILNVVAGRRYLFVADLWSSVAAKAQVRLDWRDASTSKRVDTVTGSGASSWLHKKVVYTAPTGADRVVVQLGGVTNFTGTVRHDNVALFGETAPWGVSTSPDGATTYAVDLWKLDTDATTPVNRVLVIGTGISGWREHAASIAYYNGQKFEAALRDERVSLTSGIDSRAAWAFGKYAFPARSGTYRTTHTGLAAGQWQIIEDTVHGTVSIEWIAQIATMFVGAGQVEFAVTYGGAAEDLATTLAGIGSILADGEMVPGFPGTDHLVTSGRIVDGAVIADALAANAVTETKIADDAVKTPKLYAGAVTAAKIAALAVETDKLAANAVTAAKIAAGTITANEIAAGAVETDKLAANAVTAAKISVGAITPAHLLGDPKNLVPNPSFEQLDSGEARGWNTRAAATGAGWDFRTGGTGGAFVHYGANSLQHTMQSPTADAVFRSDQFPVMPGRRYRVKGYASGRSGNNGGAAIYFAVIFLDAAQATVGTSVIDTKTVGATQNWEADVLGPTVATAPTSAKTAYIYLRHSNSGVAGDIVYFDDIEMQLADQDVDHAAGNVVIDSTGVTITNGKLTVSNPGVTVIIDGTSNMFKIAATGTLSIDFPAAANVDSTSVQLTALGTMSVTPVLVASLTEGSGWDDPRGPGYYSSVIPSDAGKVRFFVDAFAALSGTAPAYPVVSLVAGSILIDPGTTAALRYYVMKEAGL